MNEELILEKLNALIDPELCEALHDIIGEAEPQIAVGIGSLLALAAWGIARDAQNSEDSELLIEGWVSFLGTLSRSKLVELRKDTLQ